MSNNWQSLDNAALIFAAASEGSDTQVFRISCELNEEIEPALLQSALNETMDIFRLYQSVLKPGLFWYYLERTDLMPQVHQENSLPCENIYKRNRKRLLFDVSYFRSRINLEIYHVLADGTGALNFLKTLVTKYLSLAHGLNDLPLPFDASAMQMNDDSFRKYYSGTMDVKRKMHGPACRLYGRRYPEDRLKVITGVVNLEPLLEAAHVHHTTLTVFLCACLMEAVNQSVSVRQKKYPVVLAVPVDLRQYFPSGSVRNFFSILLVEYDYLNRSGDFDDVIKKISDDFKTGLSQENLAKWIDSNSAIQHLAVTRATPLVLKDLALRAAYKYSMRLDTAGFSNIGIITMPPELTPFIRSFNFYSGTSKLQVCVCSFQGRISISFSSPFMNSEIQRRFFRFLTGLGAEVEITTNHADEGKGNL